MPRPHLILPGQSTRTNARTSDPGETSLGTKKRGRTQPKSEIRDLRYAFVLGVSYGVPTLAGRCMALREMAKSAAIVTLYS